MLSKTHWLCSCNNVNQTKDFFCKHCGDAPTEDGNFELEPSFKMKREEVIALMKVLEHEFISYEAELAHSVLRRMQIFLKEQKENNGLA